MIDPADLSPRERADLGIDDEGRPLDDPTDPARERAEAALRATLDRLDRQRGAHAAALDDPDAFAVDPPATPRDELRALLAESAGPLPPSEHHVTRYIRGEFAVPDRDLPVARVQAQPYPLRAHDAARALGVEGMVGVHVGFRWANLARRWEVCLVDRDGEPVGEWRTVEPPQPA